MKKLKFSRTVSAKEGVDDEGKPLENMELYADTIEYELPDDATEEQLVAHLQQGMCELLEKLFTVKIDVVEEDDNVLIIPDHGIKLPPGFKARGTSPLDPDSQGQ